MANKSIIDDKKFEAQLRRTQRVNVYYTKQKDILKSAFFNAYNQATVTAFLKVMMKGRTEEQAFAKEFEKVYNSGNFDDTQLVMFKKFFNLHKEEIMKSFDEEG